MDVKTCQLYAPTIPKPAVGNLFDPDKTNFNEIVSLDLKHRNTKMILYMIDIGTPAILLSSSAFSARYISRTSSTVKLKNPSFPQRTAFRTGMILRFLGWVRGRRFLPFDSSRRRRFTGPTGHLAYRKSEQIIIIRS